MKTLDEVALRIDLLESLSANKNKRITRRQVFLEFRQDLRSLLESRNVPLTRPHSINCVDLAIPVEVGEVVKVSPDTRWPPNES
jgi:hypothetical protein